MSEEVIAYEVPGLLLFSHHYTSTRNTTIDGTWLLLLWKMVEIDLLKSQWTAMPSLACHDYRADHFQKVSQGDPEVFMSKARTICPLHCQKKPRRAYQNQLQKCSIEFCKPTLPDRCAEMNLLQFQVMGMREDSATDIEMGIEMVAYNMQSLPSEPLLVDKDEPSSNAAEVCKELQSIPVVPCRMLHIQCFEGAKDWCHRQEIDVECDDNRDLNLVTVLQKFCMNRKVVVRMIN